MKLYVITVGILDHGNKPTKPYTETGMYVYRDMATAMLYALNTYRTDDNRVWIETIFDATTGKEIQLTHQQKVTVQ